MSNMPVYLEHEYDPDICAYIGKNYAATPSWMAKHKPHLLVK